MGNITVDAVVTTDSIIAILGVVVTIAIAVTGGIYKIMTNTKKYELTENYRGADAGEARSRLLTYLD